MLRRQYRGATRSGAAQGDSQGPATPRGGGSKRSRSDSTLAKVKVLKGIPCAENVTESPHAIFQQQPAPWVAAAMEEFESDMDVRVPTRLSHLETSDGDLSGTRSAQRSGNQKPISGMKLEAQSQASGRAKGPSLQAEEWSGESGEEADPVAEAKANGEDSSASNPSSVALMAGTWKSGPAGLPTGPTNLQTIVAVIICALCGNCSDKVSAGLDESVHVFKKI